MPSDQIRDFLIHDYIDSTAAAVAAQFPAEYPQASSVPAYAYKSIGTLLGYASATLPLYIVANYGEANIPAQACIIIQATEIHDSVSYGRSIIKNDNPGAETAIIDIFVKNIRTSVSVSLVKLVSLRIRFLLDQNLRQLRGLAPDIPINVFIDPSIHDDYFKCFVQDLGTLTSAGWATRYQCDYVRSYPMEFYY